MKKVVLSIEGMTCAACSSGLEKYLNKQEGIEQASVNLVMNNATIEYDEKMLEIEDLNKFVKKAGFTSLGVDKLEFEKNQNDKEKKRLIITSVISVLILYVSMAHMIHLPIISFLDMTKNPFNYAIYLLVLTISVFALNMSIIGSGFKNLFHKTSNMDTLVTLGVSASFLYSLYGTIQIIKGHTEYVSNLYYESSVMVILFIQIGKYIENKNKNKSTEALKSLVTITPKFATIIKDGAGWRTSIDEIKEGDILLCRPGEKIAVDGTIIDGITHIDESFLTGESIPAKKGKNSRVIAGSINYEGTIMYVAEKIGKDSTISGIVKMVAEAISNKPPIAKVVDTISRYFVPSIIIVALLSFIYWVMVSNDIAGAVNVFVSVLVVACPCSLGLATPLSIAIASGLCSKSGILIKSSDILENVHKVKTVVFDKTGTLTNGILDIAVMYNYTYKDEVEIIKQIASIENNSEHPVGKAIAKYAQDRNIVLEKVNEFKAIPGYGVYGRINNDEYYIGSKRLMLDNSVLIEFDSDEEDLIKEGNTAVYVSKNKELIALIGFKDTIRESAKNVVHKLKGRNIDVVMLTGDNETAAKFVANGLGIENVIANVSPKEKASKIKKMKKKGLVLMCGDGINDSVSLAKADIGVSISDATDVAINSAQVVLMNDNLEKINDLINISNLTIKNIIQNLFWAFFYNLCMIPIAMGVLKGFGIMLNPMIAALAMTLSSLTVVLNALRLRRIL